MRFILEIACLPVWNFQEGVDWEIKSMVSLFSPCVVLPWLGHTAHRTETEAAPLLSLTLGRDLWVNAKVSSDKLNLAT